MVFSLFKKKVQKMPEREVMRPKQATAPNSVLPAPPGAKDEAVKTPEPLPDLEFTTGPGPAVAADKAAGSRPSQPKTREEMALVMSEFEREFTDSSVMAIDVDHGAESIQADIEQVAVLYANGQDAALTLFSLEKAAYEVAYEAENRPTWLPVPLQGLHGLLNGLTPISNTARGGETS